MTLLSAYSGVNYVMSLFFFRDLSGETLHDELLFLEGKIRDLEQGYDCNSTLIMWPLQPGTSCKDGDETMPFSLVQSPDVSQQPLL